MMSESRNAGGNVFFLSGTNVIENNISNHWMFKKDKYREIIIKLKIDVYIGVSLKISGQRESHK